MKVLMLICLFVAARAEVDSAADSNVSADNSTEFQGYHLLVGIPAAERIRIREAVASRISNGYQSFAGEHPYVAALLITLNNGRQSMCGGTLVSNKRVLTAATCWFDGTSQASNIQVVLGSVFLYTGGIRVNVLKTYQHPLYYYRVPLHNLALMVIPQVKFNNYIQPVTLPYGAYLSNTFEGWTATMIGYGSTSKNGPITSRQSQRDALVSVLFESVCRAQYGTKIHHSNVLCTSGEGDVGACGGDMGGPVVVKEFDGSSNDLLIGVISYGHARGCQSTFATVHTRVSYYSTWINNLF